MIDDALRPAIAPKATKEARDIVSFELSDPKGAELPASPAGLRVDATKDDQLEFDL